MATSYDCSLARQIPSKNKKCAKNVGVAYFKPTKNGLQKPKNSGKTPKKNIKKHKKTGGNGGKQKQQHFFLIDGWLDGHLRFHCLWGPKGEDFLGWHGLFEKSQFLGES